MSSTPDELNYQPISITGQTYLPMDFLIATNKDGKSFEAQARSIGCIRQRVKSVQREGLLHEGFVVVVYLVPTNRISEFQALGDAF